MSTTTFKQRLVMTDSQREFLSWCLKTGLTNSTDEKYIRRGRTEGYLKDGSRAMAYNRLRTNFLKSFLLHNR